MKQKIIEFGKGIGTILLYFILASLGGLVLGKFYYSKNIWVATLSQLGLYLFMLLCMILIYHKRLIHDLKTFKKEYFNIAIKNWIIGLGIMIISNILIIMFVGNLAINETLSRDLLHDYPISSIIFMTFLGPLLEEITFRLSFKKAFNKWYLFSFTTAIFFGLAHIAKFTLTEFLFVIPYGALGFFFAKALYETDNVYTSFFAHMIHNTVAIMAVFLM